MLDHAAEVGGYFIAQLEQLKKKHDSIKTVRGKGLMVAAEVESAELGKHVVKAMLDRRILINVTSDTALRFLPPYIVTKAQIDVAIAALDAIFTEYANTHAVASTAGAGEKIHG